MATRPSPEQNHKLISRRVLRTGPAAEYVGLSSSKLEKMRVTGDGPRFIRLAGRAVGYDVRDLDEWLDHQRESTHDDSGQPRSAA